MRRASTLGVGLAVRVGMIVGAEVLVAVAVGGATVLVGVFKDISITFYTVAVWTKLAAFFSLFEKTISNITATTTTADTKTNIVLLLMLTLL